MGTGLCKSRKEGEMCNKNGNFTLFIWLAVAGGLSVCYVSLHL